MTKKFLVQKFILRSSVQIYELYINQFFVLVFFSQKNKLA